MSPNVEGTHRKKQRHGNATGSCTVGGCGKQVETKAAGYAGLNSSCSEGRAACRPRTSQRERYGERRQGDI